MLPLQNVPFAGFAVRFAAVQLPVTAQVVAGALLGLAIHKDSFVEGGVNCNPWCSTPPSPGRLAKTIAIGSVPLTSAYAAGTAFRSPEKFSAQLPFSLVLGAALGSTVFNKGAVQIVSAMTSDFDSTGFSIAAEDGGISLFAIEIAILLAYGIGAYVVESFGETCMGPQRDEENVVELES